MILSYDGTMNQEGESESQVNAQGNKKISLTKEQHGHVVHLLKQFQGTNTMDDQNGTKMTSGAVTLQFSLHAPLLFTLTNFHVNVSKQEMTYGY